MFLNREILEPLAAVTEAFANLPVIESTKQVHELFAQHLQSVSAATGLRLQMVPAIDVSAFRRDQRELKRWLEDLALLDPDTPRRTNRRAQELRLDLGPTLQRLQFVTAVDFAAHGAELRLFPTVIGIETAIYLVIAAILEHKTSIQVHECHEDGCERFVIHPGGKGKPRHHCREHHEKRNHRKKEE